MKKYELLITDDIFTGLRTNFNMILRKTLFTMQSKDSDGGEINLKLKIALNHNILEFDNNVFGKEMKEYINPSFEHKITSSIHIKDETSGKICGKYELISENGMYYIQELENPQRSFFDNMEENEL